MRFDRNVFSYELPTRIVYGLGAAERAGEEVASFGVKKILITTDKGIRNAGVLDSILKSLESAGIEYVIYDDVKPNSDVEQVAEATKLAVDNDCKLLMGVGGGSSMDTAKAASVTATNPGPLTDYLDPENIKNDSLPVVAVPTTSGTGAEATRFAVISDHKNDRKMTFGPGTFQFMPDMALCDPMLTVSLPPHITAATGMDALTHAMESYVNTATQPISEALAEKAMRLIANNLRAAVANGENLEARDAMMMGSLLAALAFNETRLGIAHSWSGPLGGYYPIPHGIANAILLPNVMEFNLIGNIEKYAEIARIFGENTDGLTPMEAASLSVVAVRDLMDDIGITQHMNDVVEIDVNKIPEIAEIAFQSGNNQVNPRRPSLDDLIEICKKSL